MGEMTNERKKASLSIGMDTRTTCNSSPPSRPCLQIFLTPQKHKTQRQKQIQIQKKQTHKCKGYSTHEKNKQTKNLVLIDKKRYEKRTTANFCHPSQSR